jgi:hypothetical protein
MGKKAAAAVGAAAAVAGAGAAADGGLTEYEQHRLAHIQRNKEYMLRLGVLQARAETGGCLQRGPAGCAQAAAVCRLLCAG